jgi:hypothetical protein
VASDVHDGLIARFATFCKPGDEGVAIVMPAVRYACFRPDRVLVRDLWQLLLEDYDVRGVAQAYIAALKLKSILNPKLGDIKAAKFSSSSAAREWNADRKTATRVGRIHIERELRRGAQTPVSQVVRSFR